MTWYQWATAGAALCAAVLALWPDGGRAGVLHPSHGFTGARPGEDTPSTPEERPRNWHGDDDQGYVY